MDATIEAVELVESADGRKSSSENVDDDSAPRAEGRVSGQMSLSLRVRTERPLFGTQRFFERAAEELLASTEHGIELAGAVYTREVEGQVALVGLKRCASGAPGRVPVDPSWGRILWHTHPGLKGSLAAFSQEDLIAARESKRPLLVIGFGGLSPEVVTTLTLPLGLKAMVLSAGIKGLMALEKEGRLRARLLKMGVAARVCYPSGRIQPVYHMSRSPMGRAVEEMSFAIDKGVGTMERVGQQMAKKAGKAFLEFLKNAR
jgi:hypothetical protein